MSFCHSLPLRKDDDDDRRIGSDEAKPCQLLAGCYVEVRDGKESPAEHASCCDATFSLLLGAAPRATALRLACAQHNRARGCPEGAHTSHDHEAASV